MKKITPEQKRKIVYEENHPKFDFVDEQDLGMDSHGCNVVLVILADKKGNYKGFTYRYNSEESYFDEDPNKLFDLKPEQVTVTRFNRADGNDWSDIV